MFYIPYLALDIPLDKIHISDSKINDVSLENVNNRIRTIFSTNQLVGRLLPKEGYAYENAEEQGLTWLTSLVIKEGAGKNDAKEFTKKLEDKGI
ncbi:hypothetical protein DICVIV_12984, partial [Dictyocaulus viviparus]